MHNSKAITVKALITIPMDSSESVLIKAVAHKLWLEDKRGQEMKNSSGKYKPLTRDAMAKCMLADDRWGGVFRYEICERKIA